MPNDRLRALLLEQGLTPADLAADIGVDPKTVERWITKNRTPYRSHRYATAARLGVDESHIWPNALGREEVASASENEIIGVYPHRWAVPRDLWFRFFESATRELGVLVYAGLSFAEDQGIIRLLRAKANEGVSIRMLLGRPDCEAVRQRGIDEGIGDTIGAKIRNVLVLYRPLRELDNVEIRLHDTVLYNSIYRSDDQLLVNCHVYGENAANAPVIHLRKVAGGDMVSTYMESFERVWEGAGQVE